MDFVHSIFISATAAATEQASPGNLIGILIGLAILAVLVWMFSRASRAKLATDTGNAAKESKTLESPAASEVIIESVSETNDELIAVLTAAVMASLQTQPHCELRVTSFRRIGQTAPVWNTAGRSEYIASKL